MDSVAPREIRAQFEALLIAPMLEPLTAATGATGEYEADLFAREIARHLEGVR
ncbi:MAG TPA: hypothetical protein VK760_04720 [Candidatus Acidoferrales bacterium]|jgi:hypothetical protein|nr:hypothetical protein [Candidatus Acidoferrales bacterium]